MRARDHCAAGCGEHRAGHEPATCPHPVTRLRSVPTSAAQPVEDGFLGEAPAPGLVDEVTRTRLRRVMVGFFGEFPTLDLHLGLLDARGAWYAEAALAAWSPQAPDAFFGLVHHVVRSQIPGPAPAPDIERWLEVGAPQGDPLLAERWHALRDARDPRHDDEQPMPRATADAQIAATDAVVAAWPAELWDRFVLAYVKVEHALASRAIELPPIGQ